ncbi:TPA: alpha/beta hydrolase [Vibrio vulnificus]|nr:alpha/beta hydrolase [Vibrio vulnificus]
MKVKVALIASSIILGMALFFLLQNAAIYPAYFRSLQEYELSSSENMVVGKIVVDNNQIKTLYFKGDESKPLIVFFHGNMELVDDYAWSFKNLSREIGYNIVMIEYTGYGNSDGFPSLKGSIKATNKWLEQHYDGSELILWGRSIGSAHAIELFVQNPSAVSNVIIQSGFSDLSVAVTESKGLKSLINSFLLEDYNSLNKLIETPDLARKTKFTLIHGNKDQLFSIESAVSFKNALMADGFSVNFIEFNGDHNSTNFSHFKLLMGL